MKNRAAASAFRQCTMKKRSMATSHAPLFLGLSKMGLRKQDLFRQAGTRPQGHIPLGEPTDIFRAAKVSEWVITEFIEQAIKTILL